MDITLIRYGELALKSTPVRRRFEDILVSNIRVGLKLVGLDYKVRKDFGRIFIEGYNKKMEPVLKRVFGIVSFSPCLSIETNLKKMKKEAFRLAKKFKKKESFCVRCNRIGKHNFTSQDIERQVGEEIFEKLKLKVNLTKPDNTVGIEIRENKTYIFTQIVYCNGGLPIGTAGKVACIIKDFNGVIASWLFMKRGCLIVPIVSSGKYLDHLEKWYVGRKLNPYLTKSFRDANNIVRETKSEAIVTGEALTNFKQANFDVPVFRPLVGFDKKYLLKLKKKIQTS